MSLLSISVLFRSARIFGIWSKQFEMVQYRQLDPQKSEIRLVTLLPGKPCDAIQCTLSTASLDENPTFAALSYVWGDPSATKTITVDGEPFDATLNLEECLRAIREPRAPRVLWIDAICINQKDVNEKSVQVPQMGRLYTNATEVLAWLGPSNPNIELFVSWMREDAMESLSAASEHWRALEARSASPESAKREKDWAVVQAYEGHCDLQILSYWGRMWTFQEYQLPHNEPKLLCGNMEPFQLSTVLGKLNIKSFMKLKDEAMERLAAEYEEMTDEGDDLLAQAREALVKKHLYVASSTAKSLPGLRNAKLESLANLLYLTSDRQCFDERDKVYALYGILPDAQHACPPDYSQPITEVIIQAVAFIVNGQKSSHLLWPKFGLRHERLSDFCLHPSWMPDFSIISLSQVSSPHLHTMREGVAAPLKRCEDTNTPAFVSVENATLRFGARYLGTCKVVVRFEDTRSVEDTISNILENINGILQMDMSEDRLGKPFRKPDNIISRMVRAFFAHWQTSYKHSTKEILDAIHLVLNSGLHSVLDSPCMACWENIHFGIESLAGKSVLVTEDGCLGISVCGTKDGDILVIPPEVQVPLVLRPELLSSADGIKCYKMVGTAIVDGVMGKGELFDEEFVEEIAKRDVVEFLLH